ncbi:unnamed protein product [Blumeria hordei]|uniref:Major facilitator superfamily (MFS) profile domain-containing protein n=1 Tax=Blumeria hordei TaxID=2867405 RepID=A0A383UY07_BLUHO|nr:unnamed protein product [Blumeria hordei]
MAQKVLFSTDSSARPQSFRNSFKECIFVVTLMLANASTTFIQGVIVIITANISKDLEMSSTEMAWIPAAVGLTSGSLMLFFGKTVEIWGCKSQLLAGLAWLCSFSLFASFAVSPLAINLLCGALGVGTAITSPPSMGAIFATYQEGPRRNRVTGALGAGNPLGFILGSISSGIATKFYGWRASFIVIGMFFVLLMIFTFWTVPIIPISEQVSKNAMENFDFLGTSLIVVGIALLMAGLTIGAQIGWVNYKVFLMIFIGAMCLVGFGIWEKRCSSPLLDPTVWEDSTFTLCILCSGFGYMSFITNQYWLSLYMQEVQKLAPLHIAVRFLPQALLGIVWSYIGQLITYKLSSKFIMGIGSCAYVVGAILCYFVEKDISYWAILFPQLCITVIGADFQFIVTNLYIVKKMPAQSSLAAGIYQTSLKLSIAIGIPITASLYNFWPQKSPDIGSLYHRAYTCSIIFAGISLILVPFINIERKSMTSLVLSAAPNTTERKKGFMLHSPTQISTSISPGYTSDVLCSKGSQGSLWSLTETMSSGSHCLGLLSKPNVTYSATKYKYGPRLNLLHVSQKLESISTLEPMQNISWKNKSAHDGIIQKSLASIRGSTNFDLRHTVGSESLWRPSSFFQEIEMDLFRISQGTVSIGAQTGEAFNGIDPHSYRPQGKFDQ